MKELARISFQFNEKRLQIAQICKWFQFYLMFVIASALNVKTVEQIDRIIGIFIMEKLALRFGSLKEN